VKTIQIYIDNGNVYEYEVPSEEAARDHCHAIVMTGYRSTHTDDDSFTWYPPHRIHKIKVFGGMTSNYRDQVHGT